MLDASFHAKACLTPKFVDEVSLFDGLEAGCFAGIQSGSSDEELVTFGGPSDV